MATGDTTAIYTDAIFSVRNIDEARQIILTPEGIGTDVRWETETPYIRDTMLKLFPGDGTLLDFGCGVGRLAKAWIDSAPAGHVLGVDISTSMRQLAPGYVVNDRFTACSPPALVRLLEMGLRFDGALACWAIQHVLNAAEAIDLLYAALKPGARLLVVNTLRRAVPTDRGWVNDGFDVAKFLSDRFVVESFGTLPETATSSDIARHTFIGVYRKDAAPSSVTPSLT